ncbi:hypothetical protein DFR52_10349 [Hoeflea marina]|uniref:Uncharacterized protein n=1 Tax=Hoeflea marina TaxID=274592 RepID=A0A317PHE0_9HYPH|nr:hypothetical protein DFR52_10349 [Hoeflea marina]
MEVRCSIPGCGRPTMRSTGKGLADFHCKYHVQFKSRHGSHWHPTYRAADLKPYVTAASDFLRLQRGSPAIRSAIRDLNYMLAFAGQVDPAMNLGRQSAAYRSRVAFARLREAEVNGERLLAIYLGVSALIEDDWGSHRDEEFRMVQAAKAAHRLASGTHRRWDTFRANGTPYQTSLHVYPKSTGLVLRKVGQALKKACEAVTSEAVPRIIEAKTARFGPHCSHLPGWQQAWTARGTRAFQ